MRFNSGGGRGGDRGQLVLVTAAALALTFVALGVLLNAAAFTGAQAAREDTTEGADPLTYRRAAVEGVGGAVYYANVDNYTSYERLRAELEHSVAAWSDAAGTAAAERRIGASVRVVNVTNGTQIFQDERVPLTDASNASDWTLATGVEGSRRFILNVSRDSLRDESNLLDVLSGSEAFRVNASNGSATNSIYVYANGSKIVVERIGPNGANATCNRTAAQTTIDVSRGTIDGTPCDALAFPGVDGAYDIRFEHGDRVEGTYVLVVDRPYHAVSGDGYNSLYEGTPPHHVRALFDATIKVEYRTAEVGYTANVTTAPKDRPRVVTYRVVAPNPGPPLAFAGTGANHHLHRYQVGTAPEKLAPATIEVVGRYGASVDDDDAVELPYVNSTGELAAVDDQGEITVLASAARDTRVAVGNFSGNSPSVYYVNNSDNQTIYRANAAGGSVTNSQVSTNEGHSVAGIGDFDGDGDDELVYVGTSNEVKYLEEGGSSVSTGYADAANPRAVGPPRDFDGDGTATLPVVTGNGTVRLLAHDGSYASDPLANARNTGLTPHDVDNDGALEIVYVDPDGYLKAVETGGTTWFLRDASGDKIPVKTGAGVA